MLIHSLRLENIKSYSSATFQFTPGVNSIVGHNGAGKSTIVEAIGFALFDAGKGSALTRQGSSGGLITVTVESTLDERRYDIVRRTASTWYVHDTELGTRLVAGADDVKAFLREHMGISRGADLERIFDDAVGVAQGALTAAFLQTPAKRKPVFDPLLGVDEYERAFSLLLDTRNLVRDRKEEVLKQLARVEGVLEQLPAILDSLEEVTRAVALGEASLSELEVQLAAAQAERVAWDTSRAALQRAEQAAAEANASSDRALFLRYGAESNLVEAQRAAEVVAASQAGHDAHLAHRARRASLEAQVEEGRRKEIERAGLAAQAEQHEQTAARAEAELERIAAVEASLPDLQAASETERALQARLEAARAAARQRDELQRKVAQLESSLIEERKRLDVLRTQAASAATLQSELAVIGAEESRIASAIESAVSEMSANRARGEGIKEQNGTLEVADGALCPVCEQPLTPQHRASLHSRNEVRLAELRATWTAQNQEKKRLEEERATLTRRSAELATQIAGLPNAAMLEQGERWCADLERQLAESTTALQESKSGGQEIAALEAELKALGEPRVALSVAMQVIAGRERELASRQESSLAGARIAERLAEIDAELTKFASLGAELEDVKAAEQETQIAWQRVLESQGAAAQLEARVAELATADAALKNAQQSLEEAIEVRIAAAKQFEEAKAEAARQREALAQVEAGTLRNTLAMQRAEMERLTRQHATLQEHEREATLLKAKEDEIRRQQEVIEMMRTTLKQAGPLVTRAMIARISAYAAQWFGELTGDFSRRLTWDEEYAIQVEQDGRKLDFRSMSGGEQMAAALSVRLALLRELGSIDIAFFDEPTAHLDAERREALADQIKSVRGFRQLFVISHDDTFENKTDNVIKVERRGGASRIVSS